MALQAHHDAQLLLTINVSPYHYVKRAPR